MYCPSGFFVGGWGFSKQAPQNVEDGCCAHQGAAITEKGQHAGETAEAEFDQGESDSVGRVKEGEDEQDAEIEFDERILEQRCQAVMGQEIGVYPSEGNQHATEQNVDGHQERGDHTALREHPPPEGFAFVFFVIHGYLLGLKRHEKVGDDQRGNEPSAISPQCDENGRQGLFAEFQDTRPGRLHFGGQAQPRPTVVQGKEQGDDVKDNPRSRGEGFAECAVRVWPLCQKKNLVHKEHHVQGDERAREFADHEHEVSAVVQPPRLGHGARVGFGFGSGRHGLSPQGMRSDLKRLVVVATLVC